MSRPPEAQGEPITDVRQLAEYLEAGCKPPSAWRIGTEHEKLAFRLDDGSPLPFDGRDGIAALLDGMTDFGWEPIEENGNVIALSRGKEAITLEPGGQVELSGAPLESIHQTCREVHQHLDEVKRAAEPLDVGLMGLGFNPKWPRSAIPWMPKGRYEIMRRQMERVGTLGLDMMLRTCTVQVNLDFSSEACMVQMFRASLALQPIATALFANSPFVEGRPSGFLSYRSHVWTDTDPARCGMLPFVFESGMGFERYVEYMLDVPMYFVYRDGHYIDVAGQSFRDFLVGRLPALPGEVPLMGDWVDHLTTAFPEVRLKRFLEMRGADGGTWASLCALPALWVGLLYDGTARDAAWDVARRWTIEDMARLRDDVPRHALAARCGRHSVHDIAREVLAIARAGLRARNRIDDDGSDETHYLNTLHEIVDSGRTPAEELLAKYAGPWRERVDPVYREYAY